MIIKLLLPLFLSVLMASSVVHHTPPIFPDGDKPRLGFHPHPRDIWHRPQAFSHRPLHPLQEHIEDDTHDNLRLPDKIQNSTSAPAVSGIPSPISQNLSEGANRNTSTSEVTCINNEEKNFKFVLSTRRNKTGHWIAEMNVTAGAGAVAAAAGAESPFEVQLYHRTQYCVDCGADTPPYARLSITEPPPVRVPAASGYRYFPGFGFYKRHLQELSWREARAVCQGEAADLVVINSELEARLLLELSAPLLFLQPADAWNAEAYVGIFDFQHEGNFVTVDGIPLNESGYVHWSPGEPNNHREEDCVTIVRNAMYNDVHCSKNFEFICEIPE